MPTFDDPRADAAEASAALRGLAHATRAFENPADTYPVIGDLLAGVRSLRQTLYQLGNAHIGSRDQAYDDSGNHTAGSLSAVAAADELHQAGVLLASVERHLDAASQHSGRIAWHPAEPARTAQAGTLTLTVWPDAALGEHQRYAYRIENPHTGEAVEGRDLFTGAGAPVDPDQALRELATYLSAAGQARQYALDNPGSRPENEGLFPTWAAEAARMGADELSLLAADAPEDASQVDQSGQAERRPSAAPRWLSVVFLQGAEADMVLDLIDQQGTDAAIEHLAGFDYGEETTQAALENGYVYDAPPNGILDRTANATIGGSGYLLTFSPFLGHVSLLRKYDVTPDPALHGTDMAAPASTATTAASAQRSPASPAPSAAAGPRRQGVTDWFARSSDRPAGGPSSQGPSRGLSL
jgi:hypothetical protein